MRKIENDILTVRIADHGAELSSIYDKEAECERIWDGNPAIWNRHAPILFPFVGKVKEQRYRIGNRRYEMKTQHGFARDMEFVCIEEATDHVTHQLTATEETQMKYPYDFSLCVTHRLDKENPRMLHVEWQVENRGNDVMYYSIGAHPGFALPIATDKEREQFLIEFPGKERLTYCGASLTTGLGLPQEKKTLELEDGFAPYTDDIYATYIFDFQDISVVRLARPDRTPYVTVRCPGFPMLGIWTNPDGGKFICLEPWYGRADDEDFCGSLEEKPGVRRLESGAVDQMSYAMEFHK